MDAAILSPATVTARVSAQAGCNDKACSAAEYTQCLQDDAPCGNPCLSGDTSAKPVTVTPGATYRLRVSGTYQAGTSYGNGTYFNCIADALTVRCDGLPETIRADHKFQLQVSPAPYTTPAWEPVVGQPNTYETVWTATNTNTLSLKINDDSAGDNCGGLDVEVTEVVCGRVGEPCCAGRLCGFDAACDPNNQTATAQCVPYPAGPVNEQCRQGQISAAAADSNPVEIQVQPNETYVLTVSGTYQASADTVADAQSSSTSAGAWQSSTAYGLKVLNGTATPGDWGGYVVEHRYSRLWSPQGSNVLRVRVPGVSGGLSLELCPATTCGKAGQPCCWGNSCAAGASCDATGTCAACPNGQTDCASACLLAQAGSASCPYGFEFVTQVNRTYRLSASGTYEVYGTIVADARYNKFIGGDAPWEDRLQQGDIPATLYDLRVQDGAAGEPLSTPNWGAFNAEHRYSALWPAQTTRLCVRPDLPAGATPSGTLQVSVCETVLCVPNGSKTVLRN